MMQTTKPTWYANWFESPWYMRLYTHRTEAEAQQAVALVADLAHIPRGARVLDLACGYGRHSYALAEHGYVVTGLDYSHHLIEKARELHSHPNVSYVTGDMRGPFPGAPYRAIVNFFTSFGYFDTHEEHMSVLRAVHDHLVPGGTFVLDFLNSARVRATLVPESVSMIDGATIVQQRRIEEPFVKKSILITNPCNGDYEFEERVWLYTHDELLAMCTQAGLNVETTAGNYTGHPFDERESERCIIVARRS